MHHSISQRLCREVTIILTLQLEKLILRKGNPSVQGSRVASELKTQAHLTLLWALPPTLRVLHPTEH